MSKKRENFYRRDPGLALAGMAGMSLEERGVYSTLLDLWCLLGRELPDQHDFLAASCGTSAKRLAPLLASMEAKG